MRGAAMGLLLEEHRGEIAAEWKRSVEAELDPGEAAIGFAVAPLLREMALALRGDVASLRSAEPGLARCAVLVRSTAPAPRVAREFKLLHRAIWGVLRRAGRVVSPDERGAADEWLDEALVASLDRLDRVRMRVDLLERGPVVVAPARAPRAPDLGATRPPPLPRRGPPAPPPLPAEPFGIE